MPINANDVSWDVPKESDIKWDTDEQELKKAKDKYYTDKIGEKSLGLLETGGQILSSIPSTIAGGIAGLETLIATGGDIERATDYAHRVTDTFTYSPRTESGKQLSKKVGTLFEKGAEELGSVVPMLVDTIPFMGPEWREELEKDPNKLQLAKDLGGGMAMNFLPIEGVGGAGKLGVKGVKKVVSKIKGEPKVPPKIAELDKITTTPETIPEQLELPLENNLQQVAEMQNKSPQKDLFAPQNDWVPQRGEIPLGGRERINPPRPIPVENQGNLPVETMSTVDEIARRWNEESGQKDLFGNDKDVSPVEQIKPLQNERTVETSRLPQEQVLDNTSNVEPYLQMTRRLPPQNHLDSALDKLRKGQAFNLTPEERIALRDIQQAKGQIETESPMQGRDRSGIEAERSASDEYIKRVQEQQRVAEQQGNEGFTRTAEQIKQLADEATATREKVDSLWELEEQMRKAPSPDYGQGPKTQAANKARLNSPIARLKGARRGAIDFGTNTANKQKAASKIPGFDFLKTLIPKDEVPADVISSAIKESDGPKRIAGLQSGAISVAEKNNSSLVRGVARYVQNALKRAELSERESIVPAEKAMTKLSKQEVVELSEVFKREMVEGKLISPDQLRQVGLSENQITVYKNIRAMFNEALKKQNEGRAVNGLKPITPKEAYLASRWGGDWRIPVYELRDGKPSKLVWYIAEHSKKGAENALKYLKENGVKVDESQSKLRFEGDKRIGQATAGALPDAYLTMTKILGEKDLVTQTIKELMEAQMTQEGFQHLSQSKHFKPKGDIRGFAGDRPWMDKTKDAYDMFKEQFNYARNGFKWSEMQSAVKNAEQLLTNPELMQSQPNNIQYSKDYLKNALGITDTQAIKQLENKVAKALGTERAMFYKPINNLKSYFLTSKLGMSLGYTAANLLQPLWAAARHSDLSAAGAKHSAARSMIGAMADGTAGMLRHMGVDIPMSKIGEQALHYAEANGIVSRNVYDEAAALGKNKVLETVEAPFKYTVATPEKFARLNAFMSFVHHLEQSGTFTDKMKMFQKAEELTNLTMVDYRTSERPTMFKQLGAVGNGLATLQTFKFNYYNTLHEFAIKAKQGNWKPLATWLGTQALIGGAITIPFLQEIDDAWSGIKSLLPADVFDKVKDFDVKPFIIENMGHAAFGAPSAALGVDLSSRMDASQLQDKSFEGLFPFLSDTFRQGKSVANAVMSPNETTLSQAAYDVTPTGLQGLVETNVPTFKAGVNDEGKTIYQNPRRLGEHKAQTERDGRATLIRSLGLRDLDESKQSQMDFRFRQNEAQLLERKKSAADNFYDAIVRGDKNDAKKYMNQAIRFGASDIEQSLMQNALQHHVVPSKQRAIKANSDQGAITYKRYEDYTK